MNKTGLEENYGDELRSEHILERKYTEVRASHVAQWLTTNLPMQETQETWVWSLGWKDTLK